MEIIERRFQEVDELELITHEEIIQAAEWFVETHHQRFSEGPQFAIAGPPTATKPIPSKYPTSNVDADRWALAIGRLHALDISNEELVALVHIVDSNPPTLPLQGKPAIIVSEGLYALFTALANYLYDLVEREKAKRRARSKLRQTVALQVSGIVVTAIIAFIVSYTTVSTFKIDPESLSPITNKLTEISISVENRDTDKIEALLKRLIEIEESEDEPTEIEEQADTKRP